MKNKSKSVMQCFTLVLLSVMIISCEEIVTETSVSNKTVELDSRHVLHVEKINSHEKVVGNITQHVYIETDTFHYSIELKPEIARWQARKSEPKHILLCEKDVYLHVMENRVNPLYLEQQRKISETEKNAVNELVVEPPQYLLGSYYLKFIDKRYFFKLFGDSYWRDISVEEYPSSTKACHEYEVPNDNEFMQP